MYRIVVIAVIVVVLALVFSIWLWGKQKEGKRRRFRAQRERALRSIVSDHTHFMQAVSPGRGLPPVPPSNRRRPPHVEPVTQQIRMPRHTDDDK